MTTHSRGLPDDLAPLLEQVAGADGRFGHPEHVHLAFLAVRAHGTAGAVSRMSTWLRHLTEYERVPQKYHATMTQAWTELVGHHLQAGPAVTDFTEFAARYPALLDKRLLTRHYSPAVLASATARHGWAEPDVSSFPWS